MVNIGIVKVLGFGQTQHFFTLGIGQELAVVVEQLERIPLLGIMGSGDDDTATSVLAHDSQFGGRRSGQTDIHDIKAHARECTHNSVEDHAA